MLNNWLVYSTESNKIKQTYVNGFIDVSGGDIINRNGNINIDGHIFGNNDASFNKNVNVGKNLIVHDKIFGYSDVSFNENVWMGKDVSLNGNVWMGKDVAMVGNVLVSKKLVGQSDVSLNGDVKVGGNIFVNEDMVVSKKIMAGQDVSLNGNVFVGGDIFMSGNLTVETNVDVSGNVLLNEMFINGNMTASSTSTTNLLGCINFFPQSTLWNDYDDLSQNFSTIKNNVSSGLMLGYDQIPDNGNTQGTIDFYCNGGNNGYGGLTVTVLSSNVVAPSTLFYLTQSKTYINITGNIGIGTSTPQFNVDISGNCNVSKTLTTGNITASSGAHIDFMNANSIMLTGNTTLFSTPSLTNSSDSVATTKFVNDFVSNNLLQGFSCSGDIINFNSLVSKGKCKIQSTENENNIIAGDVNLSANYMSEGSVVVGGCSNIGESEYCPSQWKISVGVGNAIATRHEAKRLRFVDVMGGPLERMTIDENGNLGVGTMEPTYNVDISGNIRATKNAFFENNVGIGKTSIEDNTFSLDVNGNTKTSGNIHVGGAIIGNNILVINETTNNGTKYNDGSFQMSGGGGIQKNLFVGGNVVIKNGSENDGQLNVKGHIDIGKNATINGNVGITGTMQVSGETTLNGNTNLNGLLKINQTTNNDGTTSSYANGSLQIAGGVGINKDVFIGGNIVLNGDVENDGNTNTGTLKVLGGGGFSKNVCIGGNLVCKNISFLSKISETITLTTQENSNVEIDYVSSQSSLYYINSPPENNFTCNIINLPQMSYKTFTISLIISTTGVIKTYANVVSFNGAEYANLLCLNGFSNISVLNAKTIIQQFVIIFTTETTPNCVITSIGSFYH